MCKYFINIWWCEEKVLILWQNTKMYQVNVQIPGIYEQLSEKPTHWPK